MESSQFNLEECLKTIGNTRDRNQLIQGINSVQEYLSKNPNMDLVNSLFNILENPNTPPHNKWGLTELLTTLGHSKINGVSDRLFSSIISGLEKYSQNYREIDEYVFGSTIALRLLPCPDSQKQRVVNQMRYLAKQAFEGKMKSDNHKGTFKDSLLVLSSYGDGRDIPFVLEFMDRDNEYEFITHTTKSLRRLLILNPEKIDEETSNRVHDKCSYLLSQFAKPELLKNFGFIFRTDKVIEVLCARLAREELDIAFGYVESSKSDSLARMMIRDIRETKRDLERCGHAGYLAKQEAYADEVSEKLKNIAENIEE